MGEDAGAAAALADRVRHALGSADPTAFRDLLDPQVRWGAPGDRTSGCHDRDQVLAWYRRARERGVRARVTEVVPFGGNLLVGLRVSGDADAEDSGATIERWQVLSVRGGRIVDIRGFETRSEAASAAGLPA
jgi:SnoaL-like domain